ncbi:hypothetical protein G3M48_009575 [Beauveria asiatica]|uniref:LPXTG-domain-containing protein n=1 Tax=Beauveria asiatica TaxID=1069075 RepID=A0AAW0RJ01_9HYPO
MPSSARCRLVLLAMTAATVTTALQVTPGSPCASLCLVDSSSSSSPSNSSGTAKIRDDEIICSNRDYASEQGQKFQRCINCLQNSTYSQGSQNDQAWFMYNLQYAYAHCVFSYPNGNGIGPYPCMTSEACGPLNVTVRRNLANNTGTDPFNYCSYRGGSSFGGTFGKCLDCMKADREHGYVANFFVALQAGCEQRPGPEGHLSLNGTLFDSRTISIVDPNRPDPSRKTGLSTGALVAVVIISVLLGLLLLGGCVFLYIRRRRRRLESDPHDGKSALEYAAARQQNDRRGPPCSKNWQGAVAHVSPFTPGSRDGGSDQAAQQQQGCPTATAIYPDEKRNGTPEKEAYNDALRSHPPVGPVRNFSHKQHPSVSDTETMPDGVAKPEQAPTTTMPSSPSSSPYSPDSYVTPSSATSATPFLAPGQTSVFPSATSVTGSSPTKQPSWDETTRQQQGRGGGLLRSKASKTDVTAPVAARQLQTTFPPPPKR